VEEKAERLASIEGEPPRLYEIPQGCIFGTRCLYIRDKCKDQYPPILDIGDRHLVSCWKYR
jgi:peptide/nickel transport system ATP-binding protein